MERRQPNLLVVMVDQLRATALGLYGNPQVRTPHLERLAAGGTVFEHAFTPSPVCVPARVSFWTGRWPHLTGSRDNRVYLQPRETHLLQLLHDAGYRCGLIGKNHCFSEPDLARYFDVVYPVGHQGPADGGGDPEVAGAKAFIRQMGGAGGRGYAAAVSPYPVERHGTWLIGDRADAFLRADDGRPFCAWVSIADPHTPYQVSEPYASRYSASSIQLPPHEAPGYPGMPEEFRLFAELMGAPEVSDDHLRFVLSIYYGMIAVIDDVVGRLLDTLEALGKREDTIVVFTSDHGDYMTEHRLVRKGTSMFDCLTHVPLLVSQPGTLAAGARRAELVSTLDVFPTLIHAMGLACPPGRSGQPLPVGGGVPEVAPREFIVSEHGLPRPRLTRAEVERRLAAMAAAGRPHRAPWQIVASGPKKMVRSGGWKYVYRPGGEDELYDLHADPGELSNLLAEPQPAHCQRAHEMQRQLLDWFTASEEEAVSPESAPDRTMAGAGD